MLNQIEGIVGNRKVAIYIIKAQKSGAGAQRK